MNKLDNVQKEIMSEEVNELKKWLFNESVRVQMEKQELKDLQDTLQEEKRQISLEKESLKRKVAMADKRIEQDEYVIVEKQKIIENAFRQLDCDKRNFAQEQEQLERRQQPSHIDHLETVTPNMFFYGVNNSLALRKRYKDLLKIYHPDNTCGNEEVVIAITKEYEMLKKKYYEI